MTKPVVADELCTSAVNAAASKIARDGAIIQFNRAPTVEDAAAAAEAVDIPTNRDEAQDHRPIIVI